MALVKKIFVTSLILTTSIFSGTFISPAQAAKKMNLKPQEVSCHQLPGDDKEGFVYSPDKWEAAKFELCVEELKSENKEDHKIEVTLKIIEPQYFWGGAWYYGKEKYKTYYAARLFLEKKNDSDSEVSAKISGEEAVDSGHKIITKNRVFGYDKNEEKKEHYVIGVSDISVYQYWDGPRSRIAPAMFTVDKWY